MNTFCTVVGMHIMEGFLPVKWAGFWFLAALPFVLISIRAINKLLKDNPQALFLLGFAGAFTFVLSALKLPSVTGSCSHPTGMGMGAILFGPAVMVVIAVIVLLFQALLLAHGGITTLGANVFSMGIIGPLVSSGIYLLLKKMGVHRGVSVFLAASLGSLATYIVTALELALAHPDAVGGVGASFLKFSAIFAVTQVPISIAEGILTVLVMNLLYTYSREEIKRLQLNRKSGGRSCEN